MEKILYPEHPILIVDDETHILEGFKFTLKMEGIDNVICCNDSRDVIPILNNREIEVLLLDLTMPDMTGEELLETISGQFPQIPAIVVTGNREIDTAVKCMQKGALDYILKPVEEGRLTASVKKAIQLSQLRKENLQLKQKFFVQKLEQPEAFYHIITRNKKMHSIFQYMEAIKKTSEPVLITGETGTGKELIAQAFHTLSGRRGKQVTVNVGGLDDTMFSDTLFGHVKGAFTDAAGNRAGFIESAASGTLFLDEIGELSLQSQVKLLRLLQEKEYYRLGDDEPCYSDALIIAATNRNLHQLQLDGSFRKDLFYRLDVHHIHLPPLRERPEDLELLVDSFLEAAARSLGKKKPTPPPELFPLLGTYHFPGNIRELRSIVYKAVSVHKSRMLSLDTIREHIHYNREQEHEEVASGMESHPLWLDSAPQEPLPTLKQAQQQLVRLAMSRAGNNQSIAARMLGITKQALSKRLKKDATEPGP